MSQPSPAAQFEENPGLLLSARDLSLIIDDKLILDRISLDIHEGEILTLIGPNGAGKSSLLKCLLGVLPASHGHVIRRDDLRVAYVPQKTVLNPSIPINVHAFLALAAQSDKAQILDALRMVGADQLARQSLHHISGGEFQRVMLARAILRQPELLVLDEATQGIDITGQQELYTLLLDIKEKTRCAILMVSHDLHLVMSNTDRVICLNQHICCSGHPESVSADPAYLQLFGLKDAEGLAVYEHHHDHHHDVAGNVVHDD